MLRFFDSCDHYTSAERGYKYTDVGGSWSIASGGRSGNRLAYSGGSTSLLGLSLDSQQEWIHGFALAPSSVFNQASFLHLYDSGTRHIDMGVNALGQLSVRRNGTVLGVGTTILNPAAWYFIELRVVIDDSAGEVELRVNGEIELNLTSQDTRNGGNASANKFYWAGDLDQNFSLDDIYICDATGSTNNTFLGDVAVRVILPDGNGNSSQLDGSDGNSTDNYLLVDETTQDGDTTYVESNIVSEKDTYTYANLVQASGTVFGLQPIPHTRKTDAGLRSIATIARHSGTEEDSADIALSTSYLSYFDIREEKPGGGAWTISDINAAEFGVKVTV